MTSLHAQLGEIDRVWCDQVQYADQQRNQRIQQSITTFLQSQQQTLQDLYGRVNDIEGEKQCLQQQVSALEQKLSEGPMAHVSSATGIDDLVVDVHQLGLRLAQAWSVRAGTRDEIQAQFMARGIASGTVQRMCSVAGFWEDLEQQLTPRRSERLQTTTTGAVQ